MFSTHTVTFYSATTTVASSYSPKILDIRMLKKTTYMNRRGNYNLISLRENVRPIRVSLKEQDLNATWPLKYLASDEKDTNTKGLKWVRSFLASR